MPIILVAAETSTSYSVASFINYFFTLRANQQLTLSSGILPSESATWSYTFNAQLFLLTQCTPHRECRNHGIQRCDSHYGSESHKGSDSHVILYQGDYAS